MRRRAEAGYLPPCRTHVRTRRTCPICTSPSLLLFPHDPGPKYWPTMYWALLVAFTLLSAVFAQSSTPAPSSSSATPSPSTTLSLTTGSYVITSVEQSGGRNITLSAVVPTTYNVTVTLSPTASAPTNTTSATPSAPPIVLDTVIDPAFGVLGALLILTGIPSAFLGHKNRWTSFFLIGFYSLSLVCLVLILKFGVLQSINPPSKSLRGLFMLACGVAGIVGGGIALFFWKATKYGVGAWGGFAFALWIQCFRDGGLIVSISYRWIMYILVAAAGFVLCTIPTIHSHILLLATAFVGASAFILGIDCYTTAGLKEFYIWNVGFDVLFPKYTGNGIKFPVTQTMQIELGLIGAVAFMGAAAQFQILRVLQKKLKEIQAEQRRRDEAAEELAASALVDMEREKAAWERDHPTLAKHGRAESGYSFSPFLKDADDMPTPSADGRRSSAFTLVGTPRQRYQSGVSDFLAAAPPAEELNRSSSRLLQSPGALPVLDLGSGIESDVPKNYIAEPAGRSGSRLNLQTNPAELEELKRKEELLAEIQTIRRSIDLLKSESPDPSSSSESRRPSLISKRTLSYDLSALAPAPSHLRPPRAADPRARVQSLELSALGNFSNVGLGIGRPTSVPLQDDDWDSYVRDRKLLQPPTGVTAPIAPTPLSPTPRVPVSPAVAEALLQRQRRESSLSFNQLGGSTPDRIPSSPRDSPYTVSKDTSDEDVPLAQQLKQHRKSKSQGGGIPVTILPPRRHSPPPAGPDKSRTRTFEELEERHREKIKELQEPVTRVQKEKVNVEEAKSRWERAKAREKEAVTKRQADKAAAYNKDAGKRAKPVAAPEGSREPAAPKGSGAHARSLSADILAAVPGIGPSSKRMSMLKVEDWQKQQQDVELGLRTEKPSDSKRKSGVPFPDVQEQHGEASGRDRRRMSTAPRDPPS
ncbi:hypothetical protein B0H21DRAFT_297027 [Amylocystis lapponica]|nr:hypothetical protein B0H21DRAFT_297027 [Amylocystis lapponica]